MLTIEFRFANGSWTEFQETDDEGVRVALRLLAAPQLFVQPHLLLASQHRAGMIPCKGIDVILARTSAPLPPKFPLNHPAGVFDFVEQPIVWSGLASAEPPHSADGRHGAGRAD